MPWPWSWKGDNITALLILRRFSGFRYLYIASSLSLSSSKPYLVSHCDGLNDLKALGTSADDVSISSIREAKPGHPSPFEVGNLHALAIKGGVVQDPKEGGGLLSLYCKCRELGNAGRLFEEMSGRDARTWTVLISGYAHAGLFKMGRKLFFRMLMEDVLPNCFTLASLLKCSAGANDPGMGKEIHGWILRRGVKVDVVLENSIVDCYVKCGIIRYAERAFELMDEKDTVSWNILMSAYLQIGDTDGSVRLFRRLPNPDVGSWNTIISGQMHNGFNTTALNILCQMGKTGPKFNKFTFSIALSLAASLALLEMGRQVHAQFLRTGSGFQSDLFIFNSLIDMYCKCAKTETALTVFNSVCCISMDLETCRRNKERSRETSILWSSVIAGHVQNGRAEDALELFRKMLRKGIEVLTFTLTSIVSACADTGTLEQGKQIHGIIEKCGPNSDIVLASAMTDMYSKCGSMEDALLIFDRARTIDRNIILWTSIITGCALHGRATEAIRLFELMITENIKPNEVSFVGVLSACSHAGLVDEGLKYFKSMQEDHRMGPGDEHFTCMVDLLGRVGQLQEAKEFILSHNIGNVSLVWKALLSACRIHKNIEIGRQATEKLVQLEPSGSGSYVLLSNMCAHKKLWEEAASVRNLMKERGIKKEPGQSWIQSKNKVHTFLVGDRSHPQIKEIYAYLEILIGKIKEIGYETEADLVLQDVEEEQRETLMNYHSEKLAIAYGIMSTPCGTPIRIMKNLRVCSDCHRAIKYISHVSRREIILRDARRFHHFKDGQCSCGDFW